LINSSNYNLYIHCCCWRFATAAAFVGTTVYHLFLQCKFCRSSCMVFYIHIHRRLDVSVCLVAVRVDFLVSGMEWNGSR